MRVRISYGVNVEDVPEKAQDIGQDAIFKLQTALETLSKALDNIEQCSTNYSLVLEMLEKVRLELTSSDQAITDLEAILAGLQNYHNGVRNVSERRPTMDSSGDTTAQTTDPGQG